MSVSARGVSVHANKPEKKWEGRIETQQTQVSHFFFSNPQFEPPPSPSVSEKLRVPPLANKAIRDGKDADTAAFQRHSRTKEGEERERGRAGSGGD